MNAQAAADAAAATANTIAVAITNALANLQPPAPQQPPPLPVPVVVDFARTPAQSRQDLLDYKNNTGDAKIFAKATSPLETTFSLTKPNVTVFVSEVTTRSKAMSWGALMQVTINAVNMNLLESYGRITLPELRTHVNTFIDTETRVAQNDYQLYLCLASSVDGDTKEIMESERVDYLAGTVVPPGAAGPLMIESGLLYAKKLLIKAEADTRATTAHARSNLNALDQYMANIDGSDIKEFNKYVKRQVQTLTARGETTHDLVINLFKGYLCAKCEKFTGFIERKKELYIENAVNYTPETLMTAAEQHYEALKLEGAWNAVSPHEQQVLALTAQLEALKKSRNPRKERVTPGKQLPPSQRFTGKQAWKAEAPKTGEANSKTVGKIKFHWCPHHGFWTAHKPDECTLATSGKPDTKNTSDPNEGKKKPMTFAQAAAAVIDNEDQDNDESDE